MDKLFRGIALSIGLYCVVTGLLILTITLCGGDFHKIPGMLYLGIGVCTGIGAGIINDKLD